MKEYEPYQQKFSFSCGAASLKIAYKSLGIDYPEEVLVTELGTSIDGTSWEEIFDHVKRTGFRVELKGNVTYNDLLKDQDKGIIFLSWISEGMEGPEGHFGLLSYALPDMLELADPSEKEENWPTLLHREEFEAKWWEREYLLLYTKRRKKLERG